MKKISTLLFTTLLTAYGATFNVSTTPELRTALSTAATNGEDDTIILADGTYKTTDDSSGKFIYLSNEDFQLTVNGINNVLIDGNNTDDCFYIKTANNSSINLENFTVENCNVGIDIPNSFIARDLIIKNNASYGIYSVADNSPIEIYN